MDFNWNLHDKVMSEIQREWEMNSRHETRREIDRGIKSSQISALVAYLIKIGVIIPQVPTDG